MYFDLIIIIRHFLKKLQRVNSFLIFNVTKNKSFNVSNVLEKNSVFEKVTKILYLELTNPRWIVGFCYTPKPYFFRSFKHFLSVFFPFFCSLCFCLFTSFTPLKYYFLFHLWCVFTPTRFPLFLFLTFLSYFCYMFLSFFFFFC